MIGRWNRGSSWEGRCWVFLLWSCSTVGIFSCHLSLVVWALRLYYCWNFSQSHLNYGLPAIDCRCYFHQATGIDPIEVKSQDCNNHGSGPAVGVMGATLTLSWPNPHVYVPTKSTVAKTRDSLVAGVLIVHSEVLFELSLQSWSQECQVIVFVASRRSFSFSFLFVWPLRHSCRFCLTSLCKPPTGWLSWITWVHPVDEEVKSNWGLGLWEFLL